MELRKFWKNDIARNGLRLVYSTGCPEPYPAQINITASLILSVVFSLGSAFVTSSVKEWVEANQMTETYRGPVRRVALFSRNTGLKVMERIGFHHQSQCVFNITTPS